MMKKFLSISATIIIVLSTFVITGLSTAKPARAATDGRLIDDSVWDDSGSMSSSDIQNFLNTFPSSCLKYYFDAMPDANPTNSYFNYSGVGSAAMIIRRVADVYSVNPRVILSKLQQEQSLVAGGSGCAGWRYYGAMGFNCPDGQSCPVNADNGGFSKQVTRGMWLLKMTKERANGNLNWMVPDDASWVYGGPMTQGWRKRCGTCSNIYYDGYWNNIYLETGATAALYNYTPHVPSSFDNIFESYFGGTTLSNNIGTVAYRLYYPGTYNHLYIARDAQRDYAKRLVGWKEDGIAFKVLQDGTTGGVPVYDLYNGRLTDHMYVTDGLDRYWALIFGGYADLGIAFYAYADSQPSTLPVYRLWSGGRGDHFYTTSDAEKTYVTNFDGYKYDKVGFYVPQ